MEYEALMKAAPFLSGLDFDAQWDTTLARLKENEDTSVFWAFWADVLLSTVEDAVAETDAGKAAWAMAFAQRCRAMFVFKEHFEEVAWMGHSAKRLVHLLEIWDANKGNDSEEFWQATLQEHSFAFSERFCFPSPSPLSKAKPMSAA